MIMKRFTSLSRTVLASALVFGACASATAAQDSTSMTVEPGASLQATLLPAVNIVGNTSRPFADAELRVAQSEPLSITLLPTVHVNARAPELAVTVLPTVRVFASAQTPMDETVARVERAGSLQVLPRVEVDASIESDRPSSLRARVMPR
jgi:hypothetical protein